MRVWAKSLQQVVGDPPATAGVRASVASRMTSVDGERSFGAVAAVLAPAIFQKNEPEGQFVPCAADIDPACGGASWGSRQGSWPKRRQPMTVKQLDCSAVSVRLRHLLALTMWQFALQPSTIPRRLL